MGAEAVQERLRPAGPSAFGALDQEPARRSAGTTWCRNRRRARYDELTAQLTPHRQAPADAKPVIEDASMTSSNVTETESDEPSEAASVKSVDDRLIDELVGRSQAEGLQLTAEGGLLQQLTKRLLESDLEGEITDHLGYDKHDPAGKNGGNSRNGTRAKTVLTDVGPVEISVPRDRESSFEPKIVKKRQKRLSGVYEMVISLAEKGLSLTLSGILEFPSRPA